LPNGWAICLIADGLGSAKHSDAGAFLAVSTVIDHLAKFCPKKWAVPKMISVLKEAYSRALENISRRAVRDRNSVDDYDTTLTVAVYNGNQAVFGHVGDGGIVTLCENGDFKMLTNPQKGGEFNTVSPLKCREKWSFGNSENNICALAMFTDGIYDVVCPWILSGQKQPVYVQYIRPFMDRNILKADSMKDFVKIRREVEEFLNSDYNAKITDDKTIAAVINLETMPAVKPDDYYREPDWEGLQNEKRKKLYS
jgi:serine/threonine protein phosphatase PrpC